MFPCFHSVSVMAITLNQLLSFLAVAREGSVSGAAEKLYVTQPSISAAVSALSRELDVDLTERVGRGIGLTAAGEAFRPYAADVLGLIEQGRQAAREAADVSMRSLRLVADHGLRPATLTLGSNGAIKEAVRLGLGVSLQSRVAVEHELREGALAEITIRGGLPQRQWYALHSATVPPRPAVEQFLEFANGPAGRRAFEKRGTS